MKQLFHRVRSSLYESMYQERYLTRKYEHQSNHAIMKLNVRNKSLLEPAKGWQEV